MTLLIRIVTAMTVLALVAPSIARAGGPSATTSALSGTVRDDQGAPIAGATVTLNGPATYRATTDSKGAFSIVNTEVGLYRLTISHAGYDQATDTVPLFAGETQTVDAHMHIAT